MRMRSAIMDDSALRADRQVARNCGPRAKSPRGVVLADPADVFEQRHNMEIRSSGLEPTNLDCVSILDTSLDPLTSPLGPSNRSPVLGSICSEDGLRKYRRWSDDDIARLKRLQASGASPARASVALNRNRVNVMERARALGVPFMTMRERRKRQASREVAERMAAGLPPEQRR
jgi:hypothetical protein